MVTIMDRICMQKVEKANTKVPKDWEKWISGQSVDKIRLHMFQDSLQDMVTKVAGETAAMMTPLSRVWHVSCIAIVSRDSPGIHGEPL